jgi:hypothetical protein
MLGCVSREARDTAGEAPALPGHGSASQTAGLSNALNKKPPGIVCRRLRLSICSCCQANPSESSVG